MKLYTEEQVIKIAKQARLQGFWNDEEFTAIELPTDEEIKEAAKDYHWKNGVYYAQEETFIDAIKWVIDKIKNQQ